MRVLHTADVHLGDTSYGRWQDQLEDTTAVLHRFGTEAFERQVDAAIIAGDTWDSRKPSPQELYPFAELARRLSLNKIPLIIGAGNHDGPGEIGYARTKTTGWLDQLQIPNLHAFPDPAVRRIPTKSGDLRVYSVPYPHKRAFDERPGTLQEKIEAVSKAVEVMIQQVFDPAWQEPNGLAIISRHLEPFIFVGHLSVLNAQLGAEQAMRMGWDVTIRPEVLAGFDYAALGHIHRVQQVAENAWYSGSPAYSDFGEVTQHKSFLDVVIGDMPGIAPVVTEVPTGCRPMFAFDVSEEEDWTLSVPDLTGGIVLIRFHPQGQKVPAEIRRGRIDALKAAGAHWIRYTTIRPKPQARQAVPAAATMSIGDQVGRYFISKGLPEQPYKDVALELIRSVDSP